MSYSCKAQRGTSHTRRLTSWPLIPIAMLCLIVVLQIFGSPISFLDLDGSADLLESVFLEEVTMAASADIVDPIRSFTRYSVELAVAQGILLIHLPFHPPRSRA
jgi:hypothetical protein